MFTQRFLLLVSLVFLPAYVSSAADNGLKYPAARKADVADDFHGTRVPDPYRWLEDPDSDETRAWVQAENKVTFSWLERIPARKKLQDRLTRLWNYEKYGIPTQKSGRYFYTRNDGLQDQAVLYWADSLNDPPKTLIDPNRLSENGTVAIQAHSVSRDGRWVAYGISSGGSDWAEWHVREIETGKDLDDLLKGIKFSNAAWDLDGKGFYYSRYEMPDKDEALRKVNEFQKFYYHRLGTDQSEDRLIYEQPDHKDWGFRGRVTDDGRYLVLTISKGTAQKNRVFFQDLSKKEVAFEPLVDAFKGKFQFIDNEGSSLWFLTDFNAPKGRVIAIDVNHPEEEHWKTVIPESDSVLRSINVVNHTFIASYLKDACSEVLRFDMQGKPLGSIPLPGLGTVSGFAGKKEDKETFYSFTGFSDPGTVFRYDLKADKSEVFRRPKLAFDPEGYETRQVFYSSKDGTQVPMFLIMKKGLERERSHPVLLHGYGGFNISMTPKFSVERIAWMEMGGIYAEANLRGGGEYGRAWHDAGRLENKQNTFDDFIAAAEWLIKEGYTTRAKLAIEGASNGGLLVGACMTQRPDLFGACLPDVGVMDMLRFPEFTIGWAWVSDYGSPDDPDGFRTLYSYSPYHNLKEGVAYPATLITTADHDDRVVPAHSFKFAARLQEVHAGEAPVLIRIETLAGHGGGMPTSKRIEEAADRLAFLCGTLKVEALD
ncbi:MAG: prolyl oligopeptidase family serine peptidase [Planctomycetota bacterium]